MLSLKDSVLHSSIMELDLLQRVSFSHVTVLKTVLLVTSTKTVVTTKPWQQIEVVP